MIATLIPQVQYQRLRITHGLEVTDTAHPLPIFYFYELADVSVDTSGTVEDPCWGEVKATN